jgi:co-chaperonin GroES (HSP10)
MDTTETNQTTETEAPRLEGTALVDATWAELGHRIAAVGHKVFLRTDLPRKQTAGGIYIPPMLATQYGQRLGSQVLVTGTVLSVGPLVKGAIKVGDRIAFFRLTFGWTNKLNDDTLVGWIPESDVLGLADSDTVAPFG